MTTSTNHPTPPPTIWIVEDQDNLRENLQRLCSPARNLHCTAAFPDGDALRHKLRKTRVHYDYPQVLLMEMGLQGCASLQVLDYLFRHAPNCRVVILTRHKEEDRIAAAFSAGACGYILKSTPPDDLVAAIHEAARGGSPMSPPVAASVVKLLARFIRPVAPVDLSPRERDMLSAIVEGLSAKEIADRFQVSVNTIDTHTRHLFRKLDVHSRAAAVARAIREKMV